jgi:hypothetical protein
MYGMLKKNMHIAPYEIIYKKNHNFCVYNYFPMICLMGYWVFVLEYKQKLKYKSMIFLKRG